MSCYTGWTECQLYGMSAAPQNTTIPNNSETLVWSIRKGTYPDAGTVITGNTTSSWIWSSFDGNTIGNHGNGDYYMIFTGQTTGNTEVFCMERTGTNTWTINKTCTITPPDTSTRIDSVKPYNGQVINVASTTEAGAVGYINADDFKAGSRIRIKLDRATDSQAAGIGFAAAFLFGNWTELPLSATGAFDVSTTTLENTFGVDRQGRYDMTTVLQAPSFGVFGVNLLYKDLVSTTTYYTYGTSTAVDIINDHTGAVLDAIASTTDPFADCQFDFSALDLALPGKMLKCVTSTVISLVIPSRSQLSTLLNVEKEEFLSKPPFAYVYLTATALLGYNAIATSTASSSNVTITFPSTGYFASSTAPVSVAGQTITFIDWEQLADSVESLSGTSYYTGFGDFFNLMFAVGFLMWLYSFGARNFIP